MTRRRVAVTGGAGRLGRYIVDELAPRHDVRALDRVASASMSAADIVDITNFDDLRRAIEGMDSVIHVAGIDGHIQTSAEDFFKVNVFGVWNVLQASADAGIGKIVITSSTAVTGLNTRERRVVPAYLPVDEEHPLLATDAYGIGKHLDEVMAAAFSRRYGMAVTCIRPTYIAFPELISHLMGRTGPIGPGTPAVFHEAPPLLRTYVDPSDLARCYRLALEHDAPGFDVFWASAQDTFEPTPTLEYAKSAYGMLPEVKRPEIYAANAHASMIDCSKAREILDWVPQTDWESLSHGIDISKEDRP